MRFNCNKWGCSYFSDRQFEPEEFTLLNVSAPVVSSVELDDIKKSGKLPLQSSAQIPFAVAAIKCPECELMFFMPAKKALEEGLQLRSDQTLLSWKL